MKKSVVNRRKGFTLVELVIVIAVIAVLAAILIPTFTDVFKNAKIAAMQANAKTVGTKLQVEAAFDDVEYYSSEEVIEICEENGLSLKSDVNGYSYYYNLSKNTIEVLKDDDLLANEQTTGSVKTVYAAGENDYPIAIETINENKPQYRHIDQGNGKLAQVIKTIKTLSDGRNTVSALQSAYNGLTKDFGKAADHFNKYKPANGSDGGALYINSDGRVITDGLTSGELSFDNVVISARAYIIEACPVTSAITVKNKIIVPSGVAKIENGAFNNYKPAAGSGESTVTIIVGGNTDVSGVTGVTVWRNTQSGNKVTEILKYGTHYTLDYTKTKVGVFSDGSSEKVTGENVTLTGASGYTTTGKTLVREYIVPEITIDFDAMKLAFNSSTNIETVDIRSTLDEGLIKYSMLVVADGKTFIARNVAVITEAGVRFGNWKAESDTKATQELSVYIANDVTKGYFDNLKELKYSADYKVGTMEYDKQIGAVVTWTPKPGTKVLGTKTGSVDLNTYSKIYKKNFGSVALSGTTDNSTFKFEYIQLSDFTIKKGDVVIYKEYYNA